MTSKYAPIHQAFAEQIEFFRQKLNLPTEVWDDIERAAHDRAFVVAGAQGADLLYDLRGAIDKAIEQGTGLAQFRKDFAQIVAKHGWTGWTGEGTKAGAAWRTKVIYQTNMATSYAAGRWKQLNDPELLKIMPYWQYHHNDSVLHPRPLHLLWNGLTLPPNHPFFKTHFPPGGWGCLCWVSAVTKEKYMLAIANGKSKPPEGWDAIDPKTSAPVGIDKGFDYAPGANVDRSLKDFIDQKLIKLDAPIGAAMWEVIKPVLMAEQSAAVREMVIDAAATMRPKGISVLAYVVTPKTVDDLTAHGEVLKDAAVWLRDHELVHAIREYKNNLGHALPLDIWMNLSEKLDNSTPYFDMTDKALIYAIDIPEKIGKIVVRINYSDRVNRKEIKSNFIRTGGIVEEGDLLEMLPGNKGRRYVPLDR